MFKDLTNQVFNNLIVEEYIGKNNKGKSLWKCKCLLCGNYTHVISADLISGHKRSCGCLRLEETLNSVITHNSSYTRLYSIWTDIKQRCYNKNSNPYKNYGGRGITMCKDWKEDFTSFKNWSLQ